MRAFETLRAKLAADNLAQDVGSEIASQAAGQGLKQLAARAGSTAARVVPFAGPVVGAALDFATAPADEPFARTLAGAAGSAVVGGLGGAAGLSVGGPVGAFAGGTAGGVLGKTIGQGAYDLTNPPAMPVPSAPRPRKAQMFTVPPGQPGEATVTHKPAVEPVKRQPTPDVSYLARRVQARAANMNRLDQLKAPPSGPMAGMPQPTPGGARLPPFASPGIRGPQ